MLGAGAPNAFCTPRLVAGKIARTADANERHGANSPARPLAASRSVCFCSAAQCRSKRAAKRKQERKSLLRSAGSLALILIFCIKNTITSLLNKHRDSICLGRPKLTLQPQLAAASRPEAIQPSNTDTHPATKRHLFCRPKSSPPSRLKPTQRSEQNNERAQAPIIALACINCIISACVCRTQ